MSVTHHSSLPWNRTRPRVLVVACSDGRLQQNLDEFLTRQLGITDYDRLYAPGGPGALAGSGFDYLRGSQYRQDLEFLLQVHGVEEVLLVFHGPAPGGPDEALCAAYQRKLAFWSAEQIHAQQEQDARRVIEACRAWGSQVHCRVFRCEVDAAERIQFSELTASDSPSPRERPG